MIHVGQISNDQADAKELFKFALPKMARLFWERVITHSLLAPETSGVFFGFAQCLIISLLFGSSAEFKAL